MQPPIIIIEPGTVIVYNSINDAQNHLEAIDVENDIYTGYDAEGRLLDIKTVDNRVFFFEGENKPTHRAELEAILRENLNDVGIDTSIIEKGDLLSVIKASSVFLYTPPGSNIEIVKTFFKDLLNTVMKNKK